MLPLSVRHKFYDLHLKWDNVFNPKFGKYNGSSGPFMGHIKLGNVEPLSTKTKIPFYNQSNLRLLQQEAEEMRVLAKPEDLGVDVKFALPIFLRKKPSAAYRFVTLFTELGQYIQASMPYLATVILFKNIRVYITPVMMGMPGSSEILQELLTRIFGGEMTDGWILIIADDMYVCANTPDTLLRNSETVLEKMSRKGLSLSAVKTFLSPLSFDVFGWKWSSGTIHGVHALSLPLRTRHLHFYLKIRLKRAVA